VGYGVLRMSWIYSRWLNESNDVDGVEGKKKEELIFLSKILS
jgi:hypothetical protein